MIRLPSHVDLNIGSRAVRFNIISIQDGVYAITDPDLHLLQNEDQMTFGYIIWKDEYVYGYRITPVEDDKDKNRYCLIYMMYCGPDDEVANETIQSVVQEIANTFVLHSKYRIQNPNIEIANRIGAMQSHLMNVTPNIGDQTTPYVETLRGLAIQLRDYYTKMADQLSEP